MTNLVELSVPIPAPRSAQLEDLVAFAEMIEVGDTLSAQAAADELNALKTYRDAAEAERVEMKKPVLQAGRKIDGFWKPIVDRAEYGMNMLKDKLARHEEMQRRERLRLENKAREEQRVQEEALRREAQERENAAREEKARLEAQAKAQAEAGNVTAAAQLRTQADQAEMAGQQEAQLLFERAQHTMPLALPEPAKVHGIQPRKTWEWSGVNLEETVKAVCEGRAPLKVLRWNDPVLDAMATALGEEFNVPGCIASPRTIIAATGAK
jgi:hypothetical protein